MISDERITAIEQAARLYGPANCWTGTSGTLAAMIIELLNERTELFMNRQARLEGSSTWIDYGNVTFFQAIRNCAIETSEKHGIGKWVIEVRCVSEPETIDTFEVQTTIHAEILEPRKGDV